MDNIYLESHIHGKTDFAPSEKYSSYATLIS